MGRIALTDTHSNACNGVPGCVCVAHTRTHSTRFHSIFKWILRRI